MGLSVRRLWMSGFFWRRVRTLVVGEAGEGGCEEMAAERGVIIKAEEEGGRSLRVRWTVSRFLM
jgi:hypothetical protein